MARTIKCIFINVNSVVSRHRRHYLGLFLDKHKPDVLLMAEHGLSTRHKLDIRGYLTFRQNGGDGRRGTAILVRDSLDCERLIIETGAIENTAVKIRRVGGATLTVVSLYRRPLSTMTEADLEPLIDLANRGGLVIGGDLNARHTYWGDNTVNTAGRCLRRFLMMSPSLDIHPTDGPTRITTESSSFIDLVMTSVDMTPLLAANGLSTHEFESDHRAVEAIFPIDEGMILAKWTEDGLI